MLARDLKEFTTWFCLVVYALGGALRAPGMVLCVGEDDHLAIEVVHEDSRCDGCSEGDSDSTEGLGVAAAVPAGGHCPCVDIPLGTSTNLATTRSRPQSAAESLPDLKVATAVSAVFTASECALLLQREYAERDPPVLGRSSPLSHQRVVVLLI